MPRVRTFGIQLAGVLLAAATAACDSPVRPTPGPDTPLQVSCPADLQTESPDGEPVVVTYASPSVTGGAPPVALSCAPTSGSPFAVGSTAVICSGQDQLGHLAQCAFTTTVVNGGGVPPAPPIPPEPPVPPIPPAPPELKVTRFVAFGDSVTYGTIGLCSTLLGHGSSWRDLRVPGRWFLESLPHAYPGVLQSLLLGRYLGQPIVVLNEGLEGENITRGGALDRLRKVLSQDDPDVLLLQDGVNDLHSPATIAQVADALLGLVREAKGHGVPVLLGTLLPEREGGCRAYAPARIPPANDEIRAIASREQVGLVDLHQAFLGQESTLLDEDGLHPNSAGREKMAEVFFDAIRLRFEATTSRTSLTMRRQEPPGPALRWRRP